MQLGFLSSSILLPTPTDDLVRHRGALYSSTMASSAHPAPSSLEAPLDDSPHPPPLRSLPNLDNDDEAMTDDMRVAISALGLMRQGSLEGTTPAPNPPLPPTSLPHSTSTFPTVSTAAAPPSTSSSSYYHSRATSSSHRSDPSRSTSTASIASNSEAWTIASGTSDTGFSSPVESVSVSSGGGPAWVFGYSDAEMNDMKGLGEAELDGQETLALRGENGEEQHPSQDPRFMARVSQLPYVSGGLEWYERSKASSRVVKVRFLPSFFPPPLTFLPLFIARCRPRRIFLLCRFGSDHFSTRRSRRFRLPPTRPHQRRRFSRSQVSRDPASAPPRFFDE